MPARSPQDPDGRSDQSQCSIPYCGIAEICRPVRWQGADAHLSRQYKANKVNNMNGGLKWIQKGGGYYSMCNKHLKGAGAQRAARAGDSRFRSARLEPQRHISQSDAVSAGQLK